MLKRFTRYVTQSVAGMIGISVYILADTFFISVYSGADGLAILNLILPVYGLIYAIGAMIGIDATAGMGEDGFLLAAYGYEVTLYEQNPVIAALLKDALRRARKHPVLKDIASRMKLVEGDSVSCMEKLMDPVDVIYLDPMFPKRQKSGLINKKLQLIQKLEPPCSEEKDLFDAAIKAGPSRIIVKRPLKSVCLDGREPSYILKGKAIRYDCYVM